MNIDTFVDLVWLNAIQIWLLHLHMQSNRFKEKDKAKSPYFFLFRSIIAGRRSVVFEPRQHHFEDPWQYNWKPSYIRHKTKRFFEAFLLLSHAIMINKSAWHLIRDWCIDLSIFIALCWQKIRGDSCLLCRYICIWMCFHVKQTLC